MPDFSSYPSGSPSWVDLTTTDVPAAVEFYTALFGWAAFEVPDPAAGGYTFFMQDDKKVAAVAPRQDDHAPPMWNTSISVSDIEKTIQLAEEAGAQIAVPPMPIMSEGTFAMFIDTTGAHTYLWQPKNMIGAGIANEVNTWVWNELQTRNLAAATEFYRRVFDWSSEGNEMHAVFSLAGNPVAGAGPMSPDIPEDVPSYWLTYFRVASCAEKTALVDALGGSILVDNMKTAMGRVTVAGDPQGAQFAFIELA